MPTNVCAGNKLCNANLQRTQNSGTRFPIAWLMCVIL